jgi:predicted ATP-grasp superfamily ATP-dependent carboligase
MKSRDEKRILVLDGQKNNALVVTRSLSRRGLRVTAGGSSRLMPALISRHSDDTFVYSSPSAHPKRFLDELIKYLWTTDHFAVLPMGDMTQTILAKHKEEVEETGTIVGTEDWETFVAANDKKRLAELGEELSLPAPTTRAPGSLSEVEDLAQRISYPVLLKPRYTTVTNDEGEYYKVRISEENYVRSGDELVPRYRSLVEKHDSFDFEEDPPLVQEIIPGTTTTTCGLANEGELLAFFQEERLRMYPIGGGSSSLRQGVYEPKMLEYAREVVDALEWTGPIYVEFIESDDGEFYLIEVNGRYWGSVGCAIVGGVDVPFLHYLQLRGANPSYDQGYRTGIKQRRLFYTDIQWLIEKFSRGEYEAVGPFLKSFVDSDHDVFAVDDPLPTAAAVAWGANELVGGNITIEGGRIKRDTEG